MLNGDRDVGRPIGCPMLDKMKWDVRNSFPSGSSFDQFICFIITLNINVCTYFLDGDIMCGILNVSHYENNE